MMNYTNYTTEKPAVSEPSSASTLSGRDIAYLVFSILQFVVTVFGLVWVNHFIKRKDKAEETERLERERRERDERSERERRERAERLEKEERDKIADIINNEINKIVEAGIDEDLRKCKAKFRAMVMFHGSEEVTGLEVLRYMLLNFDNFKSGPLRKLQKELDAVVRLFRTLRIKLRLYLEGDHACPENTKKELGPLVADVGEIARSFVLGRELNTISSVLEYFGNEERDEYDSSRIKRFFPYINALCFGETSQETGLVLTSYDDQDFNFNIFKALRIPKQDTLTSRLRGVEFELCKEGKTIKVEDLRSFDVKIDAIWEQNFGHQLPIPDWSNEEHLRANILHAVRVFMFKIAEGSNIIPHKGFVELVGEMSRKITIVQVDTVKQKGRSERATMDIQRSIDHLKSPQLAYLCEQKSIADTLEQVNENINRSIGQVLNNP